MQPGHTTPTEHDPEARKKVYDLISGIRFAMFGTYDDRGTSHSRPMATIETEGEAEGDALWFFTSAGSRKLTEIAADPRVTLDYADASSNDYVSLTGEATELNDRARIAELWAEPLRTWFPDGKDDPAIRLIRVTPDSAEYWDSNSSAMVYAYGYVKARLTGTPPDAGETGRVTL